MFFFITNIYQECYEKIGLNLKQVNVNPNHIKLFAL
jgi:REP element-mobilizing transposase RayT